MAHTRIVVLALLVFALCVFAHKPSAVQRMSCGFLFGAGSRWRRWWLLAGDNAQCRNGRFDTPSIQICGIDG
jgi:hypothetical protein